MPFHSFVIAAFCALLLAGGIGAALYLWQRKRPLPHIRRRTRPRYPVVLAHGVMGFDEIKIGGENHHYFRGVTDRLKKEGCVVHRPRVAKSASIASRAEQLAAFVRKIPAAKVNIIAHSMGGLDARWAISRLGLGSKVSSLITLGTPHRGTPLADLGSGWASRLKIVSAFDLVGVDVTAFSDLTTAGMASFNKAVPDSPAVDYISVVAKTNRRSGLNPLLWASQAWLSEKSGPNDGVVPAASQKWGKILRTIQTDHWGMIGWSKQFDAAALYVELLKELRRRGH